MRIPCDLTGVELVKQLKRFGNSSSRQTGSHIRLTTRTGGQHHITIPNHSPLRIGTPSSILSEVALHLKISKVDLLNVLFDTQK